MKTNRGKFYEKGLGRNPGDRSEHVLAAPTTTMFLADLGAEVIHLEPPHGDAGDSGLYAGTDRGLEGGRRHQRNRLGGWLLTGSATRNPRLAYSRIPGTRSDPFGLPEHVPDASRAMDMNLQKPRL
jgi:hypothetical protein